LRTGFFGFIERINNFVYFFNSWQLYFNNTTINGFYLIKKMVIVLSDLL
jgi:hypothetical protein